MVDVRYGEVRLVPSVPECKQVWTQFLTIFRSSLPKLSKSGAFPAQLFNITEQATMATHWHPLASRIG